MLLAAFKLSILSVPLDPAICNSCRGLVVLIPTWAFNAEVQQTKSTIINVILINDLDLMRFVFIIKYLSGYTCTGNQIGGD